MNILVLGGGFCGSMVAKHLQNKNGIEVTLVDKNPYFVYYPSLPRLITDPSKKNDIIKPYEDFLTNTEVIIDKITEIGPKSVSTNTRQLEFDIMVISIGARYPIYLEDKTDVLTVNSIKQVELIDKKLRSSDSILVVGGGLIGTETAGELASKTRKRITLVHSHSKLIERNLGLTSDLARSYLESMGVNVLFNRKIIKKQNNNYSTNKNEQLQADLCIWCAGIESKRDLFKGFPDFAFAENGSLRVNRHLQVHGFQNIFAGGDITSIKEEKTGHNADAHSRVIANNVSRYINDTPLKTYNTFPTPLIVSLGDINGILSFPPLPGPIPAFLKFLLEKGAMLRL